MSSSRKGKRVAVVLAVVVVIGLLTAAWQYWPQLRFWYLFESLGLSVQGLPEYRHRATGIIMVRLPGGTFWMGAQSEDPEGRNYDPHAEVEERPVHDVTLRPLLIGKYEVTQGEWHAVMGDYPSHLDGSRDRDGKSVDPAFDRDRLPVERVSWDDIQEFEAKTGLALPTESQWEYACRAGSRGAYCFGDDANTLGEYSWNADWYRHVDGYELPFKPCPQPVGQKRPNAFGLHDMHGNVLEWCEDVFNKEFYSTPEATGPDPLCTSGSEQRVVRGGFWEAIPWCCRSGSRFGDSPSKLLEIISIGFRVAAPCP